MPGDSARLGWPVGQQPLHADLPPDVVLQADEGMASSSRDELGPEPGRGGLGLAQKEPSAETPPDSPVKPAG